MKGIERMNQESGGTAPNTGRAGLMTEMQRRCGGVEGEHPGGGGTGGETNHHFDPVQNNKQQLLNSSTCALCSNTVTPGSVWRYV